MIKFFTSSSCSYCQPIKKDILEGKYGEGIEILEDDLEACRSYRIRAFPSLLIKSEEGEYSIAAGAASVKQALDEICKGV